MQGPKDDAASTVRVRVHREHGTCGVEGCDYEGQIIFAFDSAVYEGGVCPRCILDGRATDAHPVDGGVMRPMVWVARGLLGEQPFARLLAAAEAQNRGGLTREMRRRLEALKRRAKKKTRKRKKKR